MPDTTFRKICFPQDTLPCEMNGKFEYFHIQAFHTFPKHTFALNKLEITLYGYDLITAGPQANIGTCC